MPLAPSRAWSCTGGVGPTSLLVFLCVVGVPIKQTGHPTFLPVHYMRHSPRCCFLLVTQSAAAWRSNCESVMCMQVEDFGYSLCNADQDTNTLASWVAGVCGGALLRARLRSSDRQLRHAAHPQDAGNSHNPLQCMEKGGLL